MTDVSINAMQDAVGLLERYDEKMGESIAAAEQKADWYEDKLGTYLVKLTSHPMGEQDSRELTKYLHMIGDLECISDHAVNLVEAAQELREKNLSFTGDAERELNIMIQAVREIMHNTRQVLFEDDLQLAGTIEPLEQVSDQLNKQIRSRHIERLTRGECTTEMGFILSDILTDLERVSDHCSNLAVAMIEIAQGVFDTHEYLGFVKAGLGSFSEHYEDYMKKYAI